MSEAESLGLNDQGGQRSSSRSAAIDLLFVLGTLFVVKTTLLKIDALWTYAGPVALLASLAVAHWRLKANGEHWSSLGLQRPERIGRTIFWTAVLLIVTVVAGSAIENMVPLISGNDANVVDPRYAGRFANVPGNLPRYLYWMTIAWVVGAFAEEMLFRGMLISRFERLCCKLLCSDSSISITKVGTAR
jgi:uncharacterized protein